MKTKSYKKKLMKAVDSYSKNAMKAMQSFQKMQMMMGGSMYQEGGIRRDTVDFYNNLRNASIVRNASILPTSMTRDQFYSLPDSSRANYRDMYRRSINAVTPDQAPANARTISIRNYNGLDINRDTVVTPGVPDTRASRFDKAFQDARKAGLGAFDFEGKKYSTNMGGAARATTPAAPTTTKVVETRRVVPMSSLNNQRAHGGSINPAAPMFSYDPAAVSYMNSPIHFTSYPRHMFQEGGEMPMDAMQPSPSDMYTSSLATGQMPPSMEEQQMMMQQQQQQGQMEQQLMALAQAIASGDQAAIEQLKQLPPEVQQQVLAMVEQMQQQGGEGQQMYQGAMKCGGKMKKRKMKCGGKMKKYMVGGKMTSGKSMYNTLGIK